MALSREQLEAALLTSPTRMGRISQLELVNGLENYLFIRGDQMSAAAAARRLGVSARTVVRWRARLAGISHG